MHPAQLLSEYPSAPPARPVTDGLVEVVVVDAPDAVSIVDSDRLAGLGLDEDGLFALGRDNLRRLEPVELTQQVQDGGVRLHIAEGESFYTATWALLLDELVDVPAHGALVGCPTATRSSRI